MSKLSFQDYDLFITLYIGHTDFQKIIIVSLRFPNFTKLLRNNNAIFEIDFYNKSNLTKLTIRGISYGRMDGRTD